MKPNKWTLCLAAAGVIGLPMASHAEEAAHNVLTSLASTTLSGYVSFSAVWNPSPKNGPIAGMVQNVQAPAAQDGFNLDVVSLTLDKPIEDGDWGAGYHVQMLMGPGANQRGTFLSTTPGGTANFGFNEAYIALKAPIGNGLELDFGQFGTYNGYEAYDVYKNPNFTKSYGFYNETSAHTGVKATYKFSDVVNFSASVANTGSAADGFGSSRVDSRASVQSKKAYLAMLTLTAPESMGFLKGGSLSFGALDGPGNNITTPGISDKDVQQLYVGGSIPTPVKDLSFGFGVDYDLLPKGTFLGTSAAYAWSAAGYASYALTEKLKSNTRVDYGASSEFWYYGSAKPQKLMSVTETLDYSLWKNVISRGEIRYDTALDGGHPYGPAGNYRHSVLLILNLIYQF